MKNDARRLLGVNQPPDNRRIDEYLSRFNQVGMDGLLLLAQDVYLQAVPVLIGDHTVRWSYVPVFMNGSGIEVSGHLFEGTKIGYNSEYQYWLHRVFVGAPESVANSTKVVWAQQADVVIRRLYESRQKRLQPAYTVILARLINCWSTSLNQTGS